LVYCSKCGAENEEDATVCKECGASLRRPSTRVYRRRRAEDNCFGSRGGSNWFGLFIGAMIILAGLSQLLQGTYWWASWDRLWPIPVILLGLIIVFNALSKSK
jgi:ribosomal protein L40E